MDELQMLLRENMVRGVGGIGEPTLYAHALSGTKRLVCSYAEELVACVDAVAFAMSLSISARERFLADSRQAYGRSALLLSGGLGMGVYPS